MVLSYFLGGWDTLTELKIRLIKHLGAKPLEALYILYKVVCVFCLSRRISLTAKLILFPFTVKLLIGPGKVLNYFWRGCLHFPPPKKKKIG